MSENTVSIIIGASCTIIGAILGALVQQKSEEKINRYNQKKLIYEAILRCIFQFTAEVDSCPITEEQIYKTIEDTQIVVQLYNHNKEIKDIFSNIISISICDEGDENEERQKQQMLSTYKAEIINLMRTDLKIDKKRYSKLKIFNKRVKQPIGKILRGSPS